MRKDKNTLLKHVFAMLMVGLSILQCLQAQEEDAAKKEIGSISDDPYASFPVKPGEHTKVTPIDCKNVMYDIYLPTKYDPKREEGYPVLYTFNPGGGGMVGDFQAAAERYDMIVVGNIGSRNVGGYEERIAGHYAITKDLIKRVRIDPAAQFAAGFSGGAWASYEFCQFNAPLMTGVLAMGGWLGMDATKHHFLPKLAVARVCGDNDKGSLGYIQRDGDYLRKNYGATVKDWSFKGGHGIPPDDMKPEMLCWLLQNRRKTDLKVPRSNNSKDFSLNAKKLADTQNWNALLQLCMSTMFSQPRTWDAFNAEKTFFELISDPIRSAGIGPQKIAGSQKDNNVQLRFLEYMLQGAGYAGDIDAFTSLFRLIEGSNQMTEMSFAQAVWIKLFSGDEKLKDTKGALQLVKKYGNKFNGDLESQICIASAYAVNNQMDKAKNVFNKIDKAQAEHGWSDRYGRLKDLIK